MAERRKDSKNRVLKSGESERKSGGYQYRWSTPDKKRHTVYAPTLKKLREKEAKIQKDLADGICTHSANVTINDIFNTWIKLKTGIRKSTLMLYEYDYRHFIMDELGACKISVMKKSDIRKFYKKSLDEFGLSLGTIKNIHTLLNQLFELAKDDDLIRKNPCHKALKEFQKDYKSEPRKSLTHKQQKIFFDFLKSNKKYNYLYPIFSFMIGTGMRVGEVTGLRWEDVDFEKNVINVTHTLVYLRKTISGDESRYVLNPPKSKAGYRSIPMTQNVKEALRMEKERQRLSGINCRSNIDGYTNFVFLNRFGGVRDVRSLNASLRRIIEKCNQEILNNVKDKEELDLLPFFSCHILRHTFATRLCESGTNLKVVQNVLGHSNIQMTLDIYTDVEDDFKQKEFERIDDILAI